MEQSVPLVRVDFQAAMLALVWMALLRLLVVESDPIHGHLGLLQVVFVLVDFIAVEELDGALLLMRIIIQETPLAASFEQLLMLALLGLILVLALLFLAPNGLLALPFLLSFALRDEVLLVFWHAGSIHFVAELVQGVDHTLELLKHGALDVGKLGVRDIQVIVVAVGAVVKVGRLTAIY